MFHVKRILSIALYFLAISSTAIGQKMMMFKDADIPKPTTINQNVKEWNEKQPGYEHMTSLEQEFYYWVNYSRTIPAQFFDSVIVPVANLYPQLKGGNYNSLSADLKNARSLPMLELCTPLNNMAKLHANDIASHNASPSHTSTNGETFVERFKKNQLNKCGGENISFGAPNATPIFMLVMLYLDINVPDLGHRKALLNPEYINTGIGATTYKNGNLFIVEDFACSQN